MPKFNIQEGRSSDIPGISRLFFEVEQESHVDNAEFAAWWKWLYKKNPYSIQKVLIGVDEEDNVVAHMAMVPFKYLKKGQFQMGGLICQLMVAEEFRKELLFMQMELRILKEYKDTGIDFAYGLLNRPKVLNAHLALGFCQLGILPVYARPYKLGRITSNFFKSKILNAFIKPFVFFLHPFLRIRWYPSSKLEINEVKRFDSDIDGLCKNIQRSFSCSALRNSEILNWRFTHLSEREYQIIIARDEGAVVGYVVLRRMMMKGIQTMVIVDILFSPDRSDVGKALLNSVHMKAVRSNVEISACLLNPHSPLLPILKKFGFLKTPESFSLIAHKSNDPRVANKECSFDEWHITWFDHDLV